MYATHVSWILCAVVFLSLTSLSSTDYVHDVIKPKELKLSDGVTMKIPKESNDTTVVSFEIDTNKSAETGRGKQKKLMERILPLFIMPFVIQSAIVPLFLSMLKLMLLKSMLVGKFALLLIIFNAFRNHNSFKGRKDQAIADVHYGFHGNGMEEYGAYIN